MRELRMSGSVRGVPSYGHPYRDPQSPLEKRTLTDKVQPRQRRWRVLVAGRNADAAFAEQLQQFGSLLEVDVVTVCAEGLLVIYQHFDQG